MTIAVENKSEVFFLVDVFYLSYELSWIIMYQAITLDYSIIEMC
ncbi:Uncharacterised protein [Yersinia mollaretii]|nr:Uncharacterised protein [Yersinia mollaretii]CQH15380.1 Uncharacterised protein [Yersinia mollaretii]